MGVDEARDDDVAGGVDDLRAIGAQIRSDGRDLVVLDEDVGPGQLAQLWILGQDDAALYEDAIGHCVAPFWLNDLVVTDPCNRTDVVLPSCFVGWRSGAPLTA
jgi:hypothetical protein